MGFGSNPSNLRGGPKINLEGVDKLIHTLNKTVDKVERKAVKAGILAGMTPVTKAIRAEINNSPASKDVKRAARKTVGKYVKKRRGRYEAKVGLGVGKQTKKQREKTHARAGAGRGVGLSKKNIHWFALGTKEMKAYLKGVVPRAVARTKKEMLAAARLKITQVMMREVAKLRK